MKEAPISKETRSLMRKILSEDEVRLISRRLGRVMSPILGELSNRYALNIEDTIRFQAVATRLREAREHRSMDLKAAAKALGVPQYRLRYIEECRVKNLRSSDLHAYIDFLGLGKLFARWRRPIRTWPPGSLPMRSRRSNEGERKCHGSRGHRAKASAWMQAMGCKGNHIARGSGVLEFKESARQANLKELSGGE